MVLSDVEFLMNFLEDHHIPTIKKKKHTYLTYHGLEERFAYILKAGVIKTSIILQDGREFNISYITKPDVISLMRDEVSKYIEQPFNVRIESDTATFYEIDRVSFWNYVNVTPQLQNYIKNYYRTKLSENIYRLQHMVMNGKKGGLCSFLYGLIPPFGIQCEQGILIDFVITNEDIAGFCGIGSRSSANRLLNQLKEDEVIGMRGRKIVIQDVSYLLDHIAN